jgi:predicted TIM-barrel fold metal-dependent hydrolase
MEFKVFLLYARMREDQAFDRTLREATERVISESALDHVVCLALDPVHNGQRSSPELSHMWVDNEYILDLKRSLGDKVLFGASVHPYDPKFEERVKWCADQGAVLIKWLPSAQSIDLADARAAKAMAFLAHAGPTGNALPLLLHCGAEYAIPPAFPEEASRDFLSWSTWDSFRNWLRFGKRWVVPNIGAANAHIRAAVEQGAIIVLAHCGLPYFASGPFGTVLEHSDFDVVRDHLSLNASLPAGSGRFYADVSAICTPFRKRHFKEIEKLPAESLLYGSDFPTPVFELSADLGEKVEDFKAVLAGKLERVLVPEDNLLDVNHREIVAAFPGHPMFTNFGNLCESLGIRS